VIILGLDPGSRITGWGVITRSGAGWRALGCGAARLGAEASHGARIKQLHEAISKVIGEFHPGVCALESSFMSENAMSALKLGQIRGALMLTAQLHGLEVFEYAPRLIKQAVTGFGGAEKAQVAKMVKLQLGLAQLPTPADAADALAIALTHAVASRAPAR
jgi:crossover junction endodeoxyribonuclease RuvC